MLKASDGERILNRKDVVCNGRDLDLVCHSKEPNTCYERKGKIKRNEERFNV